MLRFAMMTWTSAAAGAINQATVAAVGEEAQQKHGGGRREVRAD